MSDIICKINYNITSFMSADPIVYCLQELTDYDQFERLCHDLMASQGYPSIEPLGGSKDKGRDALNSSKDGAVTTVFAYSVREDWKNKLQEDAEKIHNHGHPCTDLYFLTTEPVTSGERDAAIASIKEKYGWALQIFSLERMRTLLTTTCRHLIARHPQIFTPSLFPSARGAVATQAMDYLVIDCAKEDETLAAWLARRLTAAGYRVWCPNLSLLGGEEGDDAVEKMISEKAFRVLSLCSQASMQNPDLTARRVLSLRISTERDTEFLIPIAVDDLQPEQLDRGTRALVQIPFHRNWAEGINQLFKKLDEIDCPRPLYDGESLALQTFFPPNLINTTSETLYSNCFSAIRLPELIRRFKPSREVERYETASWNGSWAFKWISPTKIVSFQEPPKEIADRFGLASSGSAAWRHMPDVDGILTSNLISELLRRSLYVKCIERGMQYCRDTKMYYFPWDTHNGQRLQIERPDGKKTWTKPVGEKKHWTPRAVTYYRYSLSPDFTIQLGLGDEFAAALQIRVRSTDAEGRPLSKALIISRRKHLCKDWWNNDWFNRTLAIAQFLSNGAAEISIGTIPEQQIVFSASPLNWEVPVSINESALENAKEKRSEVVRPDPIEDEEEEPVTSSPIKHE